jgi:hypothetical protein
MPLLSEYPRRAQMPFVGKVAVLFAWGGQKFSLLEFPPATRRLKMYIQGVLGHSPIPSSWIECLLLCIGSISSALYGPLKVHRVFFDRIHFP